MALLIVLGIILLLLLINETDFWQGIKKDYRKLKRISPCSDIDLIRPRRKKASTAVLMLHEFSGIPRSLKDLGKFIYELDYDVFILALPGAVESPEQFREYEPPNYRLWLSYVRYRYLELMESYPHVIVIGASLGGSMGLELAAEFAGSDKEPMALVCISSPVSVKGGHFRKPLKRNLMLTFSGILSLFIKQVHTGKRPEGAKEICPIYGIEGVTRPAGVHSHRIGLRRLRRKLKRVKAPLLAFHATGDRTVDERNLDLIAAGVSSEKVEKKLFDLEKDTLTRHHRIVNHKWIKDELYQKIKEFLESIK